MTTARRKSSIGRTTALVLLISSAVFVASAVLFFAWSTTQVSIAEKQHAIAELKLAAKEHAQKKADAETAAKLAEWKTENKERARQDKLAEDMGYSIISQGFYIKYEEAQPCVEDSKRCANFSVMTGEACASGVAVTVSMYKDDVLLGSVYGLTDGLLAGGIAKLDVPVSLEADTYRLTEARCRG